MQGFGTIINSIVTLGLAMLVGFVCIKTGYITEEQKNGLSKVIVKITLPMLIISSLTQLEFDHEKLINSVYVLVISAAVVFFLLGIGTATAKIGKMEKKKGAMHRCMMTFGNVVFMAFPLIQALYGAEGLLYATIYELANDMCLWTVGVYQLTGIQREKTSFLGNFKRLLNPGTIAFAAAFILMAAGFKFDGVFGEVITGIGSTTTYLSMLFIGGTLAGVDFRHIYRRAGLFVLTVLKMAVVPLILVLLFKLIHINSTAEAVIILQASMPVSTVLVVLGMEYGGDVDYCAEGVFISHIAGLVLIPFVYFMMNII